MTTAVDTQTVAFAAPLLPGTTSRDRDEMLSCWRGERSEAHAESRVRLGVVREAVWIQPTPSGDVAVVLLEARDLGAALHGIATSSAPFDVWFRQHLLDMHGLDLSQGMTPPELVLDFTA